VKSLLAPTDGRGPFGRRPSEPGSGGRAPRLSELSRLVPRRRPAQPSDGGSAAASRPDDDGTPAATARVQR